MQESVLLFTLGNLPVTAYGLLTAVAFLLSLLLCCFLCKKREPVVMGCAVALGAFCGARLVYCAANIMQVLVDFGGIGFVFQPWRGGFCLAGAFLGGAGSLYLYCKKSGFSFRSSASDLLPCAFLALMIMRLAEYFTTQGVGGYVEEGSLLNFFPFTVMSNYLCCLTIPVFFWEALAALAGMVFCLCRRKEEATLRYGLGWLCVTQILLESLRQDDCLRFGFVKFHQLAAVLCLLGMMVWMLVKTKASVRQKWLRSVGMVFLIAILIGMEFALDKTALSHGLLYAVMAAALAGIFRIALVFPKKAESEFLH